MPIAIAQFASVRLKSFFAVRSNRSVQLALFPRLSFATRREIRGESAPIASLAHAPPLTTP